MQDIIHDVLCSAAGRDARREQFNAPSQHSLPPYSSYIPILSPTPNAPRLLTLSLTLSALAAIRHHVWLFASTVPVAVLGHWQAVQSHCRSRLPGALSQHRRQFAASRRRQQGACPPKAQTHEVRGFRLISAIPSVEGWDGWSRRVVWNVLPWPLSHTTSTSR